MNDRLTATAGSALWTVATAHVVAILLMPFLPVERTETLWRLLLAPLMLTALIAFYGAHLAVTRGRFWTVRRLAGLSMLMAGTAFTVTAYALWPGEDFMGSARYGLLFVTTGIIFGPLGLAGLVWVITAHKEGNRDD